MEEEVKRRFTDIIKRRSELYTRIGELEPEWYREMQLVGQRESSFKGIGGISKYQMNQHAEIIAQGKEHVAQLGIELGQLKEQLRQMESAVTLYREADSLWVRVNEITEKLRVARTDVPAISLEKAKEAADAAHQELVRLHEREKEIIQEEEAAKARAPLLEAEALKGRINAAQLNAEAALSRGNRNAYLKAQRDVEQLSKAPSSYTGSKAAKPPKPQKVAERMHSSLARASFLADQQAPMREMPSPQVNDIRRQILDAQRWHSALQMRVDKIELVPKLEAELELLTTQAKDVSERAFAADSGSDANLLNFNGVPERELLEMPSGGGGGGGAPRRRVPQAGGRRSKRKQATKHKKRTQKKLTRR